MTQIELVESIDKSIKFEDIYVGDFFRDKEGNLCIKVTEAENMNSWDVLNKTHLYFGNYAEVELVDKITIIERMKNE